jgi:conjugative transfer signal peptidase TraF
VTRPPWITLGAGFVACGLLASIPAEPRTPVIVFNTTTSAPIGFYWIDRATPRVGDLVIARPPLELAQWLAARRYLPSNVPLIKHVAALGGQAVCGRDGIVWIDGRRAASALPNDRFGRRLRPFQGCRRLQADEVFLLNAEASHSLDGRYFGPLPRTSIVGRATVLWTWSGS